MKKNRKYWYCQDKAQIMILEAEAVLLSPPRSWDGTQHPTEAEAVLLSLPVSAAEIKAGG
jgi:hypothetical protein